jgi:uncharacterized membrane protein YkgB
MEKATRILVVNRPKLMKTCLRKGLGISTIPLLTLDLLVTTPSWLRSSLIHRSGVPWLYTSRGRNRAEATSRPPQKSAQS